MKILLIASLADSLVNFRGPLIKAFQAKGLEVHVVAPDLPASSSIRIAFESLGVKVHEIHMHRAGINPLVDLMYLLSLWYLMRQVRPDFTLAYTVKPVIFGTLAAWLSGTPRRYVLITGLGYAFIGQARGFRGFIKLIVQNLYKLSLGRAHKVFFQNPDDEALFRELDLMPKLIPSVLVNGSGINLADFNVAPFPGEPLRFLFIGRLLGDKGVREYVEAARRIHTLHPEVEFSLVGWIDENPDAIKQVELDNWVRDGTVNYLGRLIDVRPAIANATVYVLPSYREGTPRTVLEAMAMGRPIITTDAPGCRETVIDGENGFLVPIKSVDYLVEIMLRFIDNTNLSHRMGQRSREIAEYKYDVNKVNNFMISEMRL